MSDEPLYCTLCGSEDHECGHPWECPEPGPWCEVCGVIPLGGQECDVTREPCKPDLKRMEESVARDGTGVRDV